ncbi:MAG: hypothetical protein E6Q97_17340 [Desulfurellales bacterium]|nr:MAG: hypothetical protein E6Q97_17340 [Desulfurellales bacterium]
MAWTPYHDALMSESIGLMSEPNWYSQPAITNRLSTIRTELASAGASLNATQDQKLAQLLTDFENAYTAGKQANESRYAELKSGYAARNADINNQFAGITAGYQQREADLLPLLNNMGAQARADIGQQFTQARSQAEQDLTSRGLGNTTVRSSVLGGLTSQQADSLARHDEAMRQAQFGYRSQLSGDTLGARTQQATMAAQLSGEPLGVIERRTDTAPGLSDIANLVATMGRGSASNSLLPAMVPQMTFGSNGYAGMYGQR